VHVAENFPLIGIDERKIVQAKLPPKLNLHQIDNNRELDHFFRKLGSRPTDEFLENAKGDFMHQQDVGPFFVSEFEKQANQ